MSGAGIDNEIGQVMASRLCGHPLLLAPPVRRTGRRAIRHDVAGQTEAAGTEPGSNDADDSLQYFPPENYLKFPPQVRELMRRVDIEDGPCQGYGDEREKYRACNRRHRLLVELERRGWCWGQGAVEVPISANDHWLLCSKIPTYRPGQLRSELPFPDVE